MTAASTRAGEIRAEAERIQFGRMLATGVTWLFVAAGWVAGSVWFSVRYCAVAVRYGYRQGARIQRAPQQEVERR